MVCFGPLDPNSDPFRPPATATRVFCLHCDEEFQSDSLQWKTSQGQNGGVQGFWICPTPGCQGKGFGFDIMPVDPNYRDERGGWVYFDEDEVEEELE